jgi:hypothetical protein
MPAALFQPTAVQARALEHETPESSVSLASGGITCMRQVLPFHLSTTACPGSAEVWPTATHELGDVQETASNNEGAAIVGVG